METFFKMFLWKTLKMSLVETLPYHHRCFLARLYLCYWNSPEKLFWLLSRITIESQSAFSCSKLIPEQCMKSVHIQLQRHQNAVALVSLLLTLNMFHTWFR